MRYLFLPNTLPYTGCELQSHWIRETCGLSGDAVVAFLGPCDVAREHMVDLADVAAGSSIRAALMLHLIVECFDSDLARAVLRQRLLVALAAELLNGRVATARGSDLRTTTAVPVLRRGDDLFVADRKLSVSIATASPVSTLIHLGLNVDPTGAPVAAIGLSELGVEPASFAQALMEAFVAELEGVEEARCKVRPVP